MANILKMAIKHALGLREKHWSYYRIVHEVCIHRETAARYNLAENSKPAIPAERPGFVFATNIFLPTRF